jgi:DNA-binding XRE family transcriptional regulator
VSAFFIQKAFAGNSHNVRSNGHTQQVLSLSSIMLDHLTNNEVMQLIGDRVREIRLTHNLSIEHLAEQSGLNRKTILDMEAGRDVRFSSLIKLLRGLRKLDVLPGAGGLTKRKQIRLRANRGKAHKGPLLPGKT